MGLDDKTIAFAFLNIGRGGEPLHVGLQVNYPQLCLSSYRYMIYILKRACLSNGLQGHNATIQNLWSDLKFLYCDLKYDIFDIIAARKGNAFNHGHILFVHLFVQY